MLPSNSRDRLVLLVAGLLVLFGPVLILAFTLGALAFFGEPALSRLTPVEFLELYLIDLALFAGFGYGIYRLTLWLVEDRLPASLDAIESQEVAGTPDGESEPESAEER